MLAMALELACPGLVWLAVRACLPSEEYHQHLLEWYMRFKDKRQKQGDAQSRANGVAFLVALAGRRAVAA